MLLVTLALVLALPLKALAYPGGAPTSTCQGMIPGHSSPPRPHNSAKHKIMAKMMGSGHYEVSLVAKGASSPFKGFLLEARAAQDSYNKAFGELSHVAYTINACLYHLHNMCKACGR